MSLNETLQARAALLRQVREFFYQRNILEVETPLLCQRGVTDPHLKNFAVAERYLQTSPEYAMKRLLAASSGSIFQISKAFRDEPSGQQHNPEFTLLEWYHVGFDHRQLMREVSALLQTVLQTANADEISYQALFQQKLEIDPLNCHIEQLQQCATAHGITLHQASASLDKTTWLQLLMSHCIEPTLGNERPICVYNYPAEQAALARLATEDPRVAERFEVYFKGIELANGFHELSDAKEQAARFAADNIERQRLGYPQAPIDQRLLEALEQGLPDCAGVALGIDRLLMLQTNSNCISDVLAFDWSAA